jgi:hypothetical protein
MLNCLHLYLNCPFIQLAFAYDLGVWCFSDLPCMCVCNTLFFLSYLYVHIQCFHHTILQYVLTYTLDYCKDCASDISTQSYVLKCIFPYHQH